MRIFRYFSAEVLSTTFAIALVLLVIMLMSQSAVYLGQIARGTVALSYFGKLILLNIPFLLSYILPFAFYFGVLLAYGRLYADSEMVVLQASGLGHLRLFFYTTIQALLVLIISAYLILDLNPYIINQKGKILSFSNTNVLQTLVPGEFKSLDDGKLLIYVSAANHNRTQLHGVFVAHLDKLGVTPDKDIWSVSYMQNAHQIKLHDHSYLQTHDGFTYKGIPGDLKYDLIHYQSYAALMGSQNIEEKYTRLDGMPTHQLFALTGDVKALSELEWRISLVIQIFVLTLLVVPLSRVRPRQGRYAKFLPAIMFYFIYVNLLFFARFLLENHHISPSIGLWWVHAVMLILIFLYYAKTYSWFKRRQA